MSQVRILSPRPIKSIGCRRREATMSPRHKAVPTSKSQPDCAPIFAALGDEMRLRPIAALCVVGVMSVTRLTAGTNITRQAMTKHLDLLAATGLERAVESCAVGVSSGVGRGPGESGVPFGASNTRKLLYNPRALPIRFAWDRNVGLKDYDWRSNLLICKAPVAQPDRAPAF